MKSKKLLRLRNKKTKSVNVETLIQKFQNETLTMATKNGAETGSQGFPSTAAKKPHSSEWQLHSSAEDAIKQVAQITRGALENYKMIASQHKNQYERHTKQIQIYTEERDEQLKQNALQFEDTKAAISQEIDGCKAQIENEIKNKKAFYHANRHNVQGFLLNKWVAGILKLILIVVDYFVILTAFSLQSMEGGLSNMANVFMIAGAFLGVATFTAMRIKKKNYDQIWIALSANFCLCLVILFIGHSRAEALEGAMFSLPFSYGVTFLLYIGNFLLTYCSTPTLHEAEYRQFDKNIKEAKNKIASLEKSKNKLTREVQKNKKKINVDYLKKADKLSKNTDTLESEAMLALSDYNKNLEYARESVNRIVDVFYQSIATFRKVNAEARNTDVPAYFSTPPQEQFSFTNPYKDHNSIKINNDIDMNEINLNGAKTPKYSLNGLSCIAIFFLSLLFMRCSSDSQTNPSKIVIDIYDSTDKDADLCDLIPSAKELYQLFDLDKSLGNYGVYHCVFLDGKTGVKINTYQLASPPIAWQASIKLREEEVHKWSEELNVDLSKKCKDIKSGAEQSRLYANICRTINDLYDDGSQHIIRLNSDLIEHTQRGISFYDYKKNPAKITKEKDKILEALQADCSLPDLANSKLVLAHKAKKDDELIFEIQKLYTSLFESKNCKVKFSNN